MSCKNRNQDYQTLINNGEFSAATDVINKIINNQQNISSAEKLNLEFEIAILERIRLDFTVTEQEVREYILKFIPTATDSDFKRWEASQALEWRMIDGEKRYFNRAARNLFRIDAEARKIWQEHHSSTDEAAGSGQAEGIDVHNTEIIAAIKENGPGFVKPVRLRIKQAIEVYADAVPPGETIRCWIPFPRYINQRQIDIELLSTDPVNHILAKPDQLQRTIYFEKLAVAGEKTRFEIEYKYTSFGSWTEIDPVKVTKVSRKSLKKYLKERPPHIVFTPELRAISQEVVDGETNPYLIAKKLFKWVDENIPWASAREYSTILNIPQYAIENHHGDCGIQTLTFMTLCRINGIPTRWQSGWEFKPPDDSMHDWGMIYFEPYGWVPMDVTYGIRDVDDERGKWFYVSGMDSYRTIYNDDYSQPFYP
ncbi:MAG: transglutaminase domain-containing protein, partial [Candidatus Marinimicrobia bacterium]|nr:transglutaminase domain-containing protein [Candidatus Neomarinimicrobiota bacterium]